MSRKQWDALVMALDANSFEEARKNYEVTISRFRMGRATAEELEKAKAEYERRLKIRTAAEMKGYGG